MCYNYTVHERQDSGHLAVKHAIKCSTFNSPIHSLVDFCPHAIQSEIRKIATEDKRRYNGTGTSEMITIGKNLV